eukprot:scaffold113966_cov63-Phaeocystis_antarctica.AAC.4
MSPAAEASTVALFSASAGCSAAPDRAFRRASAISAVAGDGTVGSVAGSAVLSVISAVAGDGTVGSVAGSAVLVAMLFSQTTSRCLFN